MNFGGILRTKTSSLNLNTLAPGKDVGRSNVLWSLLRKRRKDKDLENASTLQTAPLRVDREGDPVPSFH